jgi:hypothetical protein
LIVAQVGAEGFGEVGVLGWVGRKKQIPRFAPFVPQGKRDDISLREK